MSQQIWIPLDLDRPPSPYPPVDFNPPPPSPSADLDSGAQCASQQGRGGMRGRRARHLKTRETQTLNSSPFPFYWLFVPLLALFQSTRGEFFRQSTLLLGISKEWQACTTSNNGNFCAMCAIGVPVKFVVKKAGSVSSDSPHLIRDNVGFVTNHYLIQNPPSWIEKNVIASIWQR